MQYIYLYTGEGVIGRGSIMARKISDFWSIIIPSCAADFKEEEPFF
jgi:hypothetical protein